jgi:hypothetical protein
MTNGFTTCSLRCHVREETSNFTETFWNYINFKSTMEMFFFFIFMTYLHKVRKLNAQYTAGTCQSVCLPARMFRPRKYLTADFIKIGIDICTKICWKILITIHIGPANS